MGRWMETMRDPHVRPILLFLALFAAWMGYAAYKGYQLRHQMPAPFYIPAATGPVKSATYPDMVAYEIDGKRVGVGTNYPSVVCYYLSEQEHECHDAIEAPMMPWEHQ